MIEIDIKFKEIEALVAGVFGVLFLLLALSSSLLDKFIALSNKVKKWLNK